MYTSSYYLHYSKFSPLDLKYMTPSQIKRHVFPPKRKIANFFGCLGYLLVWFYPKILIDLVFFSLSMFCFFIVKCFIKLRTV